MNRFGKSLNYKFTIATISGFLISSLVFLGLFLTFYQAELEHERSQAAQEVNRLLQTSLENAMLKRDLDGLRFIVNRLGKQTNISRVLITNPVGQVRFSSHPEYMGLMLDKMLVQPTAPQTRFMPDQQGMEVLRSINPVHNKPQCQECHGLMSDHPVNGILIVDYDATSIRHEARYTTLMLMGAGALIVIINLVGGWWFIRRFILKPVQSLSAASQSLANGILESRVNLSGKDELSALGDAFNLMAGNLQTTMRELNEGQTFLQSMVDAIPDGLRIIDENFNMLLVNKAFREQTRCPDDSWVGQKCYRATYNRDEPCPAELMTCPVLEVRNINQSLKVIHHHNCCNGDVLDVEIYAAPMMIRKNEQEVMFVVESIRDLSKQVRFTHEQHLSELGRLAAGVAHEIYNPLSSMKLALSSMTGIGEKEFRSDDIGNYLNIMEQEMDQCILITDRLLRLSAAPMDQLELVDIQTAIQDILSLVKWEVDKASIEIIEFYQQQPLRVFANESEMRMLVLNLVQNAIHAMPSCGTLKITGSIDGKDIVMSFEDSGIGISQENQRRIFMPFFSRRADHIHGTGLGLPISRTIVNSFNGTLEVESEVGKGSCFIVRIPEARAQ
ncbi:MAG: HAMP domain-containing protein [Gammaproteobacteria bacterium]|nr:HAMP domain-containing protein [Gammaproteobacteria bacterium]